MKTCLHIAILGLSFSGLLMSCSKEDQKDKIINVDSEDAEMNAAIAIARQQLPKFWEVFEKRSNNESDFNLKVKITDKNGTEHFWLADLERKDGKLSGVINNDPNIVKNIKLGQRVEILEKDISDWLYLRNDGKMVGNFTLRPLFRQMPKEEADNLKQKLAEP